MKQGLPEVSNVLKWAQIVQACLASAAIVCAGVWLITQGIYRPRIDISQTVTDRQFSEEWVWLRVEISISNDGFLKYEVPEGISRVSQLIPTPPGAAEKLSKGITPTSEHGYVMLPVLSKIKLNRKAHVEPGETITIAVEHFVHVQNESVFVLAEFPSTAQVHSVRSEGVIHDLAYSANR